MIHTHKLLALGLIAVIAAGCGRHTGTRTTVVPPPQPVFPPGGLPPGAIPAPPGSGLPPNAMVAPPGPNVPPAPAAGGQPFPTAPSAPANGLPVAPQSAPPASNAPPGQVGYRWQPVVPPAAGASPLPEASKPGPTVLLLPPQGEGNPVDSRKQPQLYPPEERNAATRQRYPVGIAGFDRARETVHSGRRPSLEGLDWLKQDGYRTVVCLHRPGESTASDREQVEKRGMTFRTLAIDPRQLSREDVDAFLNLPRDTAAGKTFVYDLEGALAGPLWYLAFRLVDQNSHEVALVRVSPLGLREEQDGVAREMWQAVRKHLEERGIQ